MRLYNAQLRLGLIYGMAIGQYVTIYGGDALGGTREACALAALAIIPMAVSIATFHIWWPLFIASTRMRRG